jgi:putative methionine-R-sulfoxide reductase with GAF domain
VGALAAARLEGLLDVGAPMMLHDRLVGVLYRDSARAGTFDAEAAEIVDVIAGHRTSSHDQVA